MGNAIVDSATFSYCVCIHRQREQMYEVLNRFDVKPTSCASLLSCRSTCYLNIISNVHMYVHADIQLTVCTTYLGPFSSREHVFDNFGLWKMV